MLGSRGGIRGSDWSNLGVILGGLAVILCRLGVICGATGSSRGHIGVVLGSSWGRLGTILAPLGAVLGPPWALLGPSLSHLGHLETQCGEVAKHMTKKQQFVLCFWHLQGVQDEAKLGQVAILRPLGAILEATWRQLGGTWPARWQLGGNLLS